MSYLSPVRRLVAAALVTTASIVSAQPTNQSIPIYYDRNLRVAGFPSPVVRATIAGHTGLFLIDTGAGVHTLADWFVNTAKISTSPVASTVTGSTGNVSRIRVARSVKGQWDDGTALELPEATVVQFPPIFQSHNLAGLLSPQLLAPTGQAAVLDLTQPSLRVQTYVETESRVPYTSATAPSPSRSEACLNPESSFTNRLYPVSVSVDQIAGSMLLDTGATLTVFSDESAIARKIEQRSVPGASTQGIGGVRQAQRTVRNLHLRRGNSVVTLNPAIGDSGSRCGPDGVLGMDALRSCILILGHDSLSLSCAPQ